MRNNSNLVLLSDNLNGDEALLCEHGLCAFLDTGTHKILLDTGASEQFMINAERLCIDLKAVDYVFISHGHRDHMGGLTPFMEWNSKAKVLISPNIMNRSFFSTRNGGKRDIGIMFDWEKYRDRCIFIDQATTIDEEISVFHCDCSDFPTPFANSTLFCDLGKRSQLDDFSHELFISIGTDRPVLYVGCAHHGLLNILESYKLRFERVPKVVVGGFHLLDSKPGQIFETEEDVKRIGSYLKTHDPNTIFLTGHCTGSQAFTILKQQLNQHIALFHTGYKAQI